MRVNYHDVKQGSDDWHQLRKGRLTASHAAACIGSNEWCSPQKAFRCINRGEEILSTWLMEHGREFEETAVQAYELRTGNMAYPCGFWTHPQYPWLGASPDRRVSVDGLVEVKCGKNRYDEPTLSWLVQCTVQIACSQKAWCDLVHYVGGELSIWRVNRGLVDTIIPLLVDYRNKFLLPDRQPKRNEVPRWQPDQKLILSAYARSA